MKSKRAAIIKTIAAIVAVIFGGLTVFVGGRTLLGLFEPGYPIFLPLLIFNFVMGFIYAGTGLLIWKSHAKALKATRMVFYVNLFTLLIIAILYLSSEVVAIESVFAMTFRTAIWLAIYLAIRGPNGKNNA